jgi:hypothetical protein
MAHAAVKVRMNGTLEAADGDRSAACHEDRARINDPSLPWMSTQSFPSDDSPDASVTM